MLSSLTTAIKEEKPFCPWAWPLFSQTNSMVTLATNFKFLGLERSRREPARKGEGVASQESKGQSTIIKYMGERSEPVLEAMTKITTEEKMAPVAQHRQRQ